MILAVLLLAQAGQLPPYGESIRCAALAEAADQREDDEALSHRYFDAAIFWGLAASERARQDGLASAQFTVDQERARAFALGELAADRPGPAQELLDCLARVPGR